MNNMKRKYKAPTIQIIKIELNVILQSSKTLGVNWNDDEVDAEYAN